MADTRPPVAIDLGAAGVRAVVGEPDGSWTPVMVDGAPVCPAVVYVPATGALVPGYPARRIAQTAPDATVAGPIRRLADGELHMAGRQVDAVDLVAAALRPVVDAARSHLHGALGEVVLLTPAGWGPRWRTLMRQVARRAGLAEARLLEAPLAVAERVAVQDPWFEVGRCVVVCDIGTRCEVSAVRRLGDGFEVLSTLAADAGGDMLDAALAATLSEQVASFDGRIGATPDPEDPAVLQLVRIAKEDMGAQDGIGVSLPGVSAGILLTRTQLERACEPLCARVAELIERAVEGAELPAGSGTGVWLVGGTAQVWGLPRWLQQACGMTVRTVRNPDYAALAGAVKAHADVTAPNVTAPDVAGPSAVAQRPVGFGQPAATVPADQPATGPVVQSTDQRSEVEQAKTFVSNLLIKETPWLGPPPWEWFTVLVPALASLLLLSWSLSTGRIEDPRGEHSYLVFHWGGLVLGGLFAVVAALSSADLLAAVFRTGLADDTATTVTDLPRQLSVALLAATTGGLLTATCYAVLGASAFDGSVEEFLTWAVGPAVPLAVLAVIAAQLMASRRPPTPPGGWHRWLAASPASVVCAAVGSVLQQLAWSGSDISDLLSYGFVSALGGAFLGVAIALAMTSRLLARTALALPAILFGGLVGAGSNLAIACVYAAAATWWWARRVWVLAITTTPPKGGPTS